MRLLVVLCSLVLLLVPATGFSSSVALAQSTATREGGHVIAWRGPAYGGDEEYIDLWALKDIISSPGSRSEKHAGLGLHLLGPGGATKGVLIAEDSFGFEGDQDLMSVSRDLGWAGIDCTVWLLDRNSGQKVKVEIHVYWWAVAPKVELDPWWGTLGYSRLARVEGTIKVYGPKAFTVQFPAQYSSYVHTLIFHQQLY
jgi:hypothetical protein